MELGEIITSGTHKIEGEQLKKIYSASVILFGDHRVGAHVGFAVASLMAMIAGSKPETEIEKTRNKESIEALLVVLDKILVVLPEEIRTNLLVSVKDMGVDIQVVEQKLEDVQFLGPKLESEAVH